MQIQLAADGANDFLNNSHTQPATACFITIRRLKDPAGQSTEPLAGDQPFHHLLRQTRRGIPHLDLEGFGVAGGAQPDLPARWSGSNSVFRQVADRLEQQCLGDMQVRGAVASSISIS